MANATKLLAPLEMLQYVFLCFVLKVTITDLCPYIFNGQPNGICYSNADAMDMVQPAFELIGDTAAGYTSINIRKVPCSIQGPLRFSFIFVSGDPSTYFEILPFNHRVGINKYLFVVLF